MMPSRGFPAPPNLSELLKFFESDEGKARVSRQNGVSHGTTQRSRQSSQSVASKHLSNGVTTKTLNAAPTPATTGKYRLSQSSTTNNEHTSIRDDKTSTTAQGWNSSTQLPLAPAKTLRHQLLSRTYQPPAPVYVVPSEANELLKRLSKGTISSRSKLKSQIEPTRGGQTGDGEIPSSGVRNGSTADTRGRDAIQTLLFYRKEVEKRRRLDTKYSKSDDEELTESR